MREELTQKKTAAIQRMFGRIAHRYDLLNRVLSLGQDVVWRRRVARRVREHGSTTLLDVCTGTGDVALAIDPKTLAIGSDFCLPMLAAAKRKADDRRRRVPLFAGDALRLPLADGVVDVVTVAFGVRNFESLERGIEELTRVLCPGGRLVILEFSRPRGPFGRLLRWWVRAIPPRVGRWLSGDDEAYEYLPDSVSRFPDGAEMEAVLTGAGLERVRSEPVTWGVATLYQGTRTRGDDE